MAVWCQTTDAQENSPPSPSPLLPPLSHFSIRGKIRKEWRADSSGLFSPCPLRWQIRLNFTSEEGWVGGDGGLGGWRLVRAGRINIWPFFFWPPLSFIHLSSAGWKTVYLWIIYPCLKILNLWCPCPASYLQGHHKKLLKERKNRNAQRDQRHSSKVAPDSI